MGGAFFNLLGLLVAGMEVEGFTNAIDVTRAYLPDQSDVEVQLFLRNSYDSFANNRPVFSRVQRLAEDCASFNVEARAALVHQRTGLFGAMAVLGLVLAIIA